MTANLCIEVSVCLPGRLQASRARQTGVAILPGETLAPIGDPDYNNLIVQMLHNPALVQPRPPTDSRERYKPGQITPSVYYERARCGHQYWYQEKTGKSYSMIINYS